MPGFVGLAGVAVPQVTGREFAVLGVRGREFAVLRLRIGVRAGRPLRSGVFAMPRGRILPG